MLRPQMDEPISDAEHEEALAHTLPYEWIAQALSMASVEIADDLAETLRVAMDASPPLDRLARIRMGLLLDALRDERGVPADSD